MKSIILGMCATVVPFAFAEDDSVASRINEVEQLVRTLNGKYEELDHSISVLREKNNALEKRINEMQKAHVEAQNSNDNACPRKSGRQLVKEAETFISEKKYAKAIEILTEFVSDPAKDIYKGQGYYYLGMAYEAKQQYNKASVAYMKAHKENPEGAKSADALYRLAICQKKMKQYEKAKVVLKKLLTLYPDKQALHKSVNNELKSMAK